MNEDDSSDIYQPTLTAQNAMKVQRSYFNVNSPIEALNAHLAAGDLRSEDVLDVQNTSPELLKNWQDQISKHASKTELPLSKQAMVSIALGTDPHQAGYATMVQSGYAPTPPPAAAVKTAVSRGKIANTGTGKEDLSQSERLPSQQHPK